jgi:hypothetical protein
MDKKSRSGSYFRAWKKIFRLKTLKLFYADPDPGSGMGKKSRSGSYFRA